MPFEIDNYIYESELIIAYCKIYKPKYIKIPMNSDLIYNNLEKKEWFNKKYKNGISILDVINNPKKHTNHFQRIINANVNFPIVIWKEKKLVIDGNHRLGNAYINNDKYIKAFIFDTKLMKNFRIGKFNNREEYFSITENIKANDLIVLFYKRFIDKYPISHFVGS